MQAEGEATQEAEVAPTGISVTLLLPKLATQMFPAESDAIASGKLNAVPEKLMQAEGEATQEAEVAPTGISVTLLLPKLATQMFPAESDAIASGKLNAVPEKLMQAEGEAAQEAEVAPTGISVTLLLPKLAIQMFPAESAEIPLGPLIPPPEKLMQAEGEAAQEAGVAPIGISVTLLLPKLAIQMFPVASTATPSGFSTPPPSKLMQAEGEAAHEPGVTPLGISTTVPPTFATQTFPAASMAIPLGAVIPPAEKLIQAEGEAAQEAGVIPRGTSVTLPFPGFATQIFPAPSMASRVGKLNVPGKRSANERLDGGRNVVEYGALFPINPQIAERLIDGFSTMVRRPSNISAAVDPEKSAVQFESDPWTQEANISASPFIMFCTLESREDCTVPAAGSIRTPDVAAAISIDGVGPATEGSLEGLIIGLAA